MQKNSMHLLLIGLAMSLFSLSSCRKNNGDELSGTANTSGVNYVKATVAGIVIDESNYPIQGVVVKIGNNSTVTTPKGTFTFADIYVPDKRTVILFSRVGYWNQQHAFLTQKGTVNYVQKVMFQKSLSGSVDAAIGGIITTANASIEFAPNSFVTQAGQAYNGTVSVYTKHVSPDDALFGEEIPGGDLNAVTTAGTSVGLISFGMTGCELFGNGERLNLAYGKIATIKMQIAASQIGTAASTIPLWYLDEKTGIWHEEGSATKSGNQYIGTVSHFTWWNCDQPGNTGTITGMVKDNAGNPLANFTVTVDGFFTINTNSNGVYSSWIPTGIHTFTISNNNGIFGCNTVTANVTNNSQATLNDIIVNTGNHISGHIVNCFNAPIANAMVHFSYGGINKMVVTDYNGAFDCAVPPNKNVSLNLFTFPYSFNNPLVLNYTSGATGNNINVGILQLCNTPSALHFILDGNVFSSLPYDCEHTIHWEANYYAATDSTVIKLDASTNSAAPDLESIFLRFKGKSSGLINCTGNEFELIVQDTANNPSYPNFAAFKPVNATFHIDSYGFVGGLIKGSFSGTFENYPNPNGTSATVTITNGTFEVLRGVDK